MKPINYEAITAAAHSRAVDADHFLDQLRTVPAHWTALCDAATSLSGVWAAYQTMDTIDWLDEIEMLAKSIVITQAHFQGN